MAYALATRLERAVKASGTQYRQVSGWRNRGHATMGAIRSIMCHHTAGPKSGNTPSLNVVAYGRAGLSGPLSQLFLARDGTVYLVAAGLSYHAGKVNSSSYTNSHSIGIEAENTGLSNDRPWPPAQMNAYAKLCKALIDEFGLPVSRVIGHKEAAPSRKIDPTFDMGAFRTAVTRASSQTTPAPAPEGLFGMSITNVGRRTKNMTLPAGKWKTMPVNDKGHVSLLNNVKKGDELLAFAQVELDKLPKGSEVAVRFYLAAFKPGAATKRIHTFPRTEIIASAGKTFGQVVQIDQVGVSAPAGYQMRLRAEICAHRKGVRLLDSTFKIGK